MRPTTRGLHRSPSTLTNKRTSTSRFGAGRTRSHQDTWAVTATPHDDLFTAGRDWVYEVLFLMWVVAVQWEHVISAYWSGGIAFIRGFLG